MDLLKQFASLADTYVAWLAEESARTDPTIFAIVSIALILFSLASRRWLYIMASVFLAAGGYLLKVAPGSAIVVIGIGGWLGSLLVTFGGIRARRREIFLRRDFNSLSESVRNLEALTERHFLKSLNLRSRETSGSDDDGILPQLPKLS